MFVSSLLHAKFKHVIEAVVLVDPGVGWSWCWLILVLGTMAPWHHGIVGVDRQPDVHGLSLMVLYRAQWELGIERTMDSEKRNHMLLSRPVKTSLC